MSWLALDIGGANIKIADGQGFAKSVPFPLWKDPAGLASAIDAMIALAPARDRRVITMTGELADCFEDKSSGVHFIVEQVTRAVDGAPTEYYLCTGEFVSWREVRENPRLAAASNWHALATFSCRFARHGSAVLIDLGSTTCDIVPLSSGKPANRGQADTQRLLAHELVYTGVVRSPVCALVDHVPYRGQPCSVAQEWFATAHDVYVTLGELAEEPGNRDTADGRPMTKQHAQARLGRMLCADELEFEASDAVTLAESTRDAQASRVAASLKAVRESMTSDPSCIVISGQGEFLVRRVISELGWNVKLVSLTDQLGPLVSRCATAHALAVLAREASET